MRHIKRLCAFSEAGCENEIKYRKMGICHACYQALYYHSKLGPAHLMDYSKRLAKFTARADSLIPAKARRRA